MSSKWGRGLGACQNAVWGIVGEKVRIGSVSGQFLEGSLSVLPAA